MNIQDMEYMSVKADEVAATMGYLSNPARMRILCALAVEEMSVGELVTMLGLPQPTISQHLTRLRESGLVASRRDGMRVLNRLHDPKVMQIMALLHKLYCEDDTP